MTTQPTRDGVGIAEVAGYCHEMSSFIDDGCSRLLRRAFMISWRSILDIAMRALKKGFTPAELCPTPKVIAAGLFTALTAPEESTNIKFARPAIDLQQVSSTSAKWVPAWQQSDDGETWPASTATPGTFVGATMAPQNVEGTFYPAAAGDGFEAITLTKKYVRWGCWAQNNAGVATLEIAQCAIRIEKRSC